MDALLPLMRDYCDFYEVSPPDEGLEEMARALIATPEAEGMLLVAARRRGAPVGFAAVGWKWSSLRAARVAILEDLFVASRRPRGRRGPRPDLSPAPTGRKHGAPCLMWVTAHDNTGRSRSTTRAGAKGETWLEYELEL